MKKLIHKMGAITLLVCMVLSNTRTSIKAEEQIKEPLVFENFDSADNVAGTANSTVTIEHTERGSSAKMVLSNGGEPSISTRSLVVTKNQPVDVSAYKYVTFWVKDTGNNSARISLIDADGKSISGVWTGNVTANKWSQLSVNLSSFSTLDLTRITGIYIGEWNAGTYYIDDIQFTDVLANDMNITSNKNSGTYNDSFNVTLSTDTNQEIYYTLDGTYPTTSSLLYEGTITIEDSCTLKAITLINGNVSEVFTYVYSIDHEDYTNYQPVVVQNFEESSKFEETTDTIGAIVDTEKHNGTYALEYKKTKSESPEKTKGSMRINFQHTVNIEGLKYLVFYIKDTQGSNTMRVSLIDGSGQETDFGWRTPSTTKNEWVQYALPVADFSGIDKTNVVAMRIGQWNAGTYYIDDVYFDNYLYTGVPELTPLAPKTEVLSGYRFKDTLNVGFSNVSYADMYYTLDGSLPSKDSTKYTEDIHLTDSTTIHIVSYKHGEYSDIVSATYIKDVSVPSDVVSNKSSGKYVKPMKVILSNADALDIYYTLDGSNPTKTSTRYTEPIDISTTTEVRAVTFDGEVKGNVLSFLYTYPSVPTKVTSSVTETKLTSSKTMELLSDVDAEIYYTVDGKEPDTSSTRYTGPITINTSTTIKAIAVRDGLHSALSTMKYVIAPIAVVADKPAGTYEGSTIVEFRVPKTDQVKIYYTTDGSEPTIDSNAYTGPIKVIENTTFTVGATYMNNEDIGTISTHKFVIIPIENLVKPTITPSSGIYGQRQLVSISCDTKDSKIHYTVDGSTPSKNSPVFIEDFYITKDTVIKAVAIKNDNVSEVVENVITITKEASPFLKTDTKDMRNNYGAGQVVQLKGTNIGGWLVMEEWQCPTSAPDQLTTLKTLTERFGEDKAWELINTYEDHWFTEEDFVVLKEEGVNCLRLPITYFEMANGDGSLKQTAFDRLDWFVEEAAKHGIYTLIDMHGAFGSQNGKDHSGDITYPDVGDFFGNEDNIKKTIALWEAIATRYNGNPWVAGYDLLNEPGGALGTEQFEVYDRLYKAVRAIDQDHIIQMQAIWEPTHLPNPTLYGWENVVYQYHFYGWTDINNLDYQKAFIDSKVDFVNQQTNYNVPLLVGEFTFFSNVDSWEYGLHVFDEQGWSYTSWTYKVAGDNSSWGMYTMPKNNSTNVNIQTDSYDTIKTKWSTFDFTRNTKIADVLSTHFKAEVMDTKAPEIYGKNAKVELGTYLPVEEIIELFIKDARDGVIHVKNTNMQTVSVSAAAMYTTDFNKDKVGDYTVNVVATDTAGNQSTKTFTITVIKKEDTDSNDKDDNNGTIIPGDNNSNSTPVGNIENVPTRTGDSTVMGGFILTMVAALFVIWIIRMRKIEE